MLVFRAIPLSGSTGHNRPVVCYYKGIVSDMTLCQARTTCSCRSMTISTPGHLVYYRIVSTNDGQGAAMSRKPLLCTAPDGQNAHFRGGYGRESAGHGRWGSERHLWYLKKAIGSRNIKFASPQRFRRGMGYAIGLIPPFHWQPPQFRTFVVTALLQKTSWELAPGPGARKFL